MHHPSSVANHSDPDPVVSSHSEPAVSTGLRFTPPELNSREAALQKVAPNEMCRLLLQTDPLPHEALVPCWPWKYGLTQGRPTMRFGNDVRHPIKFIFPHSHRIKRVCGDKTCANPRHFVMVPRPPSPMQHALVFQCEELIDQFKTLADAYDGIPYPRIHVLEAWRNKIQLRLAHHEVPTALP